MPDHDPEGCVHAQAGFPLLDSGRVTACSMGRVEQKRGSSLKPTYQS